jgi:hypothetical protein
VLCCAPQVQQCWDGEGLQGPGHDSHGGTGASGAGVGSVAGGSQVRSGCLLAAPGWSVQVLGCVALRCLSTPTSARAHQGLHICVGTLLPQVRKFVQGYGGALVEEFISGREFTVSQGRVGMVDVEDSAMRGPHVAA